MRNAPNHETTRVFEIDSDQQDSAQVAALAASQVHPESALPSRPSHKQSAFVSAPAPAREQGDKASAANAVGQAERDLFERDVRDLFDGDANFQRIDGGEYIDQQMLDMWMGWSMRAAIANHRAPAADAGGQS